MYFDGLNITTEEYKNKTKIVHTAILPVGSFEQHSAHMCMGTDAIIATSISEEVAKVTNSVCLCPIVYGVSEIHKSFSGTIYSNPRTFYEYIKDIVISISNGDIDNLLIVNGHGANWFALNKVCEETNELFKNVEVVQWWEILKDNLFMSEECSHAGAQELSVLGYISKQYIREQLVADQIHSKDISILECKDIFEVTQNGVIGLATSYDFKKGQITFERVVAALIIKIQCWEQENYEST